MEQQQNQATPNRRQRRAYLKQQGIIKALAKMPYFGEVRSKVRSENIAYGKKLHAENTRRIEELNATRLEAALDVAKISWKEQGYDAAEMELLEEAWALSAIKDKSTRKEDKLTIKKLQKEARESFHSRKK